MYMKKLFLALFLLLAFNACAQDNFSLTDTAGKQHHLNDYKGKWLVVNYWATWCPPCLEEIPDLVHLYDDHKDKDIMILGVAMEYQQSKEIIDFANDMLISYPIVLGNLPQNIKVGKVNALPTTFIFNPQGELVKTKRGLITRIQIEALMKDK